MKKLLIAAGVIVALFAVAVPVAAGTALPDPGLTPGQSVIGEGLVAPDLVIGMSGGENKVAYIKQDMDPSAYGGGSDNATNACLFDGWGISDLGNPDFATPDGTVRPYHWRSKLHQYEFTFADGKTVSDFVIAVADWSDFMPNGTNDDHEYGLYVIGYDAVGNEVDRDTLTLATLDGGYSRNVTVLETGETGSTGTIGDACNATDGQPGNYVFHVSGTGIAKVVVQFKDQASMDPHIAFHNIAFTVDTNYQEQGCTLTRGYWQTHANPDKKKYDDTWDERLGADFFQSGTDYLGILKTKPKGNSYYILAAQYVAAEMNILSGAGISADELAAFQQAAALFEQYTPEDANSAKAEFVGLGEILDAYNNGITGPGHCG